MLLQIAIFVNLNAVIKLLSALSKHLFPLVVNEFLRNLGGECHDVVERFALVFLGQTQFEFGEALLEHVVGQYYFVESVFCKDFEYGVSDKAHVHFGRVVEEKSAVIEDGPAEKAFKHKVPLVERNVHLNDSLLEEKQLSALVPLRNQDVASAVFQRLERVNYVIQGRVVVFEEVKVGNLFEGLLQKEKRFVFILVNLFLEDLTNFGVQREQFFEFVSAHFTYI